MEESDAKQHMTNGSLNKSKSTASLFGPKDKLIKRKCCLCSSHSLLSSMQVMARYVQCGYVHYELITRNFCAKHSPPLNMVQSGRLLDDRQAMELAYFREQNKKKRYTHRK